MTTRSTSRFLPFSGNFNHVPYRESLPSAYGVGWRGGLLLSEAMAVVEVVSGAQEWKVSATESRSVTKLLIPDDPQSDQHYPEQIHIDWQYDSSGSIVTSGVKPIIEYFDSNQRFWTSRCRGGGTQDTGGVLITLTPQDWSSSLGTTYSGTFSGELYEATDVSGGYSCSTTESVTITGGAFEVIVNEKVE